MKKTFHVDDDYIELYKLLKSIGACGSGAEAKHAIEDGLVSVDGKVEARKRRKVRLGSVVEFEGDRIEVLAR